MPLISVVPSATNPANTSDIPPLKSVATRREPRNGLQKEIRKESPSNITPSGIKHYKIIVEDNVPPFLFPKN
jgi:hypothetical protein